MKVVEGVGPLDAKLWAIGESPGSQEVYGGTPFVGPAGKFLRSKLTMFGFSLEDIRFENLMGVQPPGNKFAHFEKEEHQQELQESVVALKERIKEGRPNLVLCLGAKPLQYLIGEKGITTWRGHVVWNDELDCKCLATYHPSACLRNRFVQKSQKPGQYEALFQADLQKATEEVKTKELQFTSYETLIQPTFVQAKNELERLINEATIVSYDIETLGGCFMDCIGFCSEPTHSCCIPLFIPNPEGEPLPYFKSEQELLEIYSLIKKLLESDVPKVAQNSQFDTVILAEHYKIQVRDLAWDTLVFAHELYSDLPKDLGTLISLYTHLPYQKYLAKSSKLTDRWEYNATDALANLHVMKGQQTEAEDLKAQTGVDLIKHYYRVPHPAIKVTVEMQLAGVKVDTDFQEQAIHREKYLQEELLTALDKALSVKLSKDPKYLHKIKPKSVPDKKLLFLEGFGCKKKYGTQRKLTLGEDAMKLYAEDSRPYVSLLAKALSKHSLSVSMLAKLETPLRNGRMHTAYSVTGTDTGRLNSKESVFGTGTNLQNLKEGPQRQMLIPDEGEEFAYVDLWQAEALLTALDANEPELLNLLQGGTKVHQWMLDETTKKFPKEVKKAEYGYHEAKQTVHSLNYGVEPPKMSRESSLPIHVTQWQHGFFHNTFPGIQLRQRRIAEQVKSQRRLVSMLGRQKVLIAPLNPELLNQAYAWGSQSTIGELTILGMIRLYYNRHPWTFPALNTHDGLAIRCKKGNREAVRQAIKDAFDIPISAHGMIVRVPIEVGFAKNFNDVENKEVLRYE